jgi:hypothetical protein
MGCLLAAGAPREPAVHEARDGFARGCSRTRTSTRPSCKRRHDRAAHPRGRARRGLRDEAPARGGERPRVPRGRSPCARPPRPRRASRGWGGDRSSTPRSCRHRRRVRDRREAWIPPREPQARAGASTAPSPWLPLHASSPGGSSLHHEGAPPQVREADAQIQCDRTWFRCGTVAAKSPHHEPDDPSDGPRPRRLASRGPCRLRLRPHQHRQRHHQHGRAPTPEAPRRPPPAAPPPARRPLGAPRRPPRAAAPPRRPPRAAAPSPPAQAAATPPPMPTTAAPAGTCARPGTCA